MRIRDGSSAVCSSDLWGAFGLQPHRSETFKLSTDPLFVDKVQDIVRLYMSPPKRAIVLCVDEKSQIQALDREQPVRSEERRVGKAWVGPSSSRWSPAH